jgi:hypothetical protein
MTSVTPTGRAPADNSAIRSKPKAPKLALLATAAFAVCLARAPAAHAIIVALPGTPTTALDTVNLTGVGQVSVDYQSLFGPGVNSLGGCTATLINPRVALTAAHCYAGAGPASLFGENPGQLKTFVDFSADASGSAAAYVAGTLTQSAPQQNVYFANQVAWAPGWTSRRMNDVGLMTLDTPVSNVPTWALLFSALPAQTTANGGAGYHVDITGYGVYGSPITGPQGLDFRRRSAENMLGALASPNALFLSPAAGNAQNYYWIDFTNPSGAHSYPIYFPNPALPNEAESATTTPARRSSWTRHSANPSSSAACRWRPVRRRLQATARSPAIPPTTCSGTGSRRTTLITTSAPRRGMATGWTPAIGSPSSIPTT